MMALTGERDADGSGGFGVFLRVIEQNLDVYKRQRQMIAKDKLKRKSSFRTLPLMPQVAAMLQKARCV